MSHEVRFRQLQREYHELSKPFVQLKVDILAVNIPTMVRFPDGHIESTYSPEVNEQLAKVDALWAEAVKGLLSKVTKETDQE